MKKAIIQAVRDCASSAGTQICILVSGALVGFLKKMLTKSKSKRSSRGRKKVETENNEQQ